MINTVTLVGRLVKDAEVKELESGKKVCNVTLAVPRSYKNASGEYETDFIDCTLWSGVAETTGTYCQKGDMVGVKGRLQTDYIEKDGMNIKELKVVAERVTFLSKANIDKNKDDMER